MGKIVGLSNSIAYVEYISEEGEEHDYIFIYNLKYLGVGELIYVSMK